MKQISVFHTGVNADIDYSKLDNNNLVFPTSDIRLTNKDGKGLIITPIKGNQKVFELTPGYLIFGATQYNGIVYIISHNPQNGHGEIGSFPSPKATSGEFEEAYKPLRNLVAGLPGDGLSSPVGPMRSTAFDFDLEYPVGDQVVALPDYDGTVNLIFTDNKNVIRLVNSGFNQEGFYKPERNYHTGTLKDSIELIKPLAQDQKIEFEAVESNGSLLHGNYFFFFRYLDQSNNPTVYLGESQPISLYDYANTHPDYKLGGENVSTNKSIVLKLSNLDTAFTFVEFAFIRFFSGVEGITLSEVQRVGKLFTIPESGELQATITGFETLVPLNIGSILEPVNNEVITESIVNYDRRMWGGNWRTRPINIPALREAALQIRLTCDDSKEIQRQEFQNFYAQPENAKFAGYFRGEAYIGKAAFKLKNGYETEAFPVRGIDARKFFPNEILFKYEYGLGTNDGIIILPQQRKSKIVQGTGGRRLRGRIMGIVFEIGNLKTWVGGNSENQQWFKENVSEVIFLRAERKPNLAYQGMSTRVWGRSMGLEATEAFGQYENNNCSMPFVFSKDIVTGKYSESIPRVSRSILSGSTENAPRGVSFKGDALHRPAPFNMIHILHQSDYEKRLRGVFSTDFIFGDKNKIADGSRPYIVPNFKIEQWHNLHEAQTNSRNHYIPNIKYRNVFDGKIVLPSTFNYAVQCSNFSVVFLNGNWIYPDNPANLRLVNRARDVSRGSGAILNDDESQSLYWHAPEPQNYIQRCNRNIQVPPYFAFELSEENKDDLSLREDCSNVSVYRFDPDSDIYYNLYQDALNLQYFKIREENVLINNLQNEPSKILCYQGDAYIQSTIVKTRTWFQSDEWGTDTGYDDREQIGVSISLNGYAASAGGDNNDRITKYAHGELTEIFTENAINTALRVRTLNENTFYPLVERTEIEWGNMSWLTTEKDFSLYPYAPEPRGWQTALSTGIESFRANFGNSKATSLKGYLADNPNIPKGDNKFPNRIRYTGQQEPNFPILSYRVWPYNSRRDFEERYGPMLKLAIVYGRLISVQRSSILLHYTNQEETVPSNTGEMIIGVRSILSAQPSTLARYGSQHKYSMVVAKAGLYGWDWMNGVIWRTAPTEDGGVIAVSLEKESLIESYVKDLRRRVDGTDSPITSNIIRGLKDLMFVQGNKQGITAAFDLDSSEIIYSVFWENSKGQNVNEIIRYSEDINSFIGTSHYPAMFFFNNYRDLFSVPSESQGDIYVHNKGIPAHFYGIYYAPRFSFIVNGTQSTRDGSTVSLFHSDKHFQAMEIESPKYPFPVEKVKFETMFQYAQNDPLYNEPQFWLTPEYLMSKWAFPINIAHSGQEDFYVDSNLMGKWMKVTVTLKKGLDTFVKNIMTIFTTTNA